MSYPNLTNEDGKPYIATCCNVTAVYLSTEIDSEYTEMRQVRGEDVEFTVFNRTHTVRCPNQACRKEVEVHDTRAEITPHSVVGTLHPDGSATIDKT